MKIFTFLNIVNQTSIQYHIDGDTDQGIALGDIVIGLIEYLAQVEQIAGDFDNDAFVVVNAWKMTAQGTIEALERGDTGVIDTYQSQGLDTQGAIELMQGYFALADVALELYNQVTETTTNTTTA
jgi:hypothetical protein